MTKTVYKNRLKELPKVIKAAFSENLLIEFYGEVEEEKEVWECNLIDPNYSSRCYESGDDIVGRGKGINIEESAINAIENYYFRKGRI